MISVDAIAYDDRPGYCWRCNAIPAPNPLGCCDPCMADLRTGKVHRGTVDMEQVARSLEPFFRANAEAMRRLTVVFGRVAKSLVRIMETAGYRYVDGHGWLLDPNHDPRTFGPRPGSLRRRGHSHR
jgi:hypothetical protein